MSKAQANTCCSQFIRHIFFLFFRKYIHSIAAAFFSSSFLLLRNSTFLNIYYTSPLDADRLVNILPWIMWVWEFCSWSEDMETTKFEELCVCRVRNLFLQVIYLNSDIWKQWKYWIAPINSLRGSDFSEQLSNDIFFFVSAWTQHTHITKWVFVCFFARKFSYRILNNREKKRIKFQVFENFDSSFTMNFIRFLGVLNSRYFRYC